MAENTDVLDEPYKDQQHGLMQSQRLADILLVVFSVATGLMLASTHF